MSDPNQPMHDPYQQPPPGTDPHYGGDPSIPYVTPVIAPRRPVSPIVLGIIGVIFAFHHTLCTGAGLAIQLSGERFIDWMAGFGTLTPEQLEQMKAQAVLTPWLIIQPILWFVLGIICWIGAIGSFIRKEMGRVALLLYALGFLVLQTASILVEAFQGFPHHRAQAEIQAASGQFSMPVEAMIAMTITCSAIFAIYPIFVLILYTRSNVISWFRREQGAQQPLPMYYGH